MISDVRWLAFVLLAACYAPHLQTGSPCDAMHPCPDPLVCQGATQTCQTVDVDAGVGSDVVLIDGCVPTTEFCGDGIDQDCDGVDPPCPANDRPSGAIDITAGGDFTADVRYAHDDNSGSGPGFCSQQGGRDVFYEIKVQGHEVYYLDTFNSDYDTVLRVYEGIHCADVVGSPDLCRNNSCGGMQTQLTTTLSGPNCVVVDQYSNNETHGALTLHVERGNRDGNRVATGANVSNGGDTSTSPNEQTGTCGAVGNDDGWYFTLCPAQTVTVTATTCNAATTWDTALYLEGPSGELVCNNNDASCTANTLASTLTATVSGAHLYWIVVDAGGAGAGSAYELDTTIQ